MIKLSYSTLNDVVNCPHSWLCKQMGLKKKHFNFMTEGTDAHRVIQEHVSGVNSHPLLSDLPTFDTVEKEDRDPDCHIEFKFNDKYLIHGYFDGYDTKRHDLLEIKSSSTPWSLMRFYNLMQWRLYALSFPEIPKKIHFVTMPRDVKSWGRNTIRIYESSITPQNLQEGREFVERGIHIIENMNDHLSDNSKACGYSNCPFGCIV